MTNELFSTHYDITLADNNDRSYCETLETEEGVDYREEIPEELLKFENTDANYVWLSKYEKKQQPNFQHLADSVFSILTRSDRSVQTGALKAFISTIPFYVKKNNIGSLYKNKKNSHLRARNLFHSLNCAF